MRKSQACRAIAACAALAILCVSRAGADEQGGPVVATPRTAVQHHPKLATVPMHMGNQATGTYQDLARGLERPSLGYTPGAMVERLNGGDDLRTLGDDSILLYSNTAAGSVASFAANFCGEEVVTLQPGVAGQAFAVDSFELALLMHTSTTTHTWAQIEFWEWDAATAGDPNCAETDVQLQKYGYVVADLGVNNDANCNVSIANTARRRLKLRTNEVVQFGDRTETTIASGIKVNKIGAADVENRFGVSGGLGSIPVGLGDFSVGSTETGVPLLLLEHRFMVIIRLGIPNGTNDGVQLAPTDACSTFFGTPTVPGAWMVYSTAAVPGTGGGFYADVDDADGTLECDEYYTFVGSNQAGPSILVRGSRGGDCDSNGIVDVLQIREDATADNGGPIGLCNSIAGNNIVDDCECFDCNNNGFFDLAEIQGGTSPDCNLDHVPDACNLHHNDCNANAVPDDCDLAALTSPDCQANGIPDECDVDPSDPDSNGFVSRNCDGDGIPDGCQRFFTDCNGNDVDDLCDILTKTMNDYNADGIPDVCGSFGATTIIDFELVGSTGYDYVAGPVHAQPDSTDPDFSPFFNWRTYERSVGDDAWDGTALPDAGFADLVAGSLGADCPSGSKNLHLKLFEINSTGVARDSYGVMAPHIGNAASSDGFAADSLPQYQAVSVKFKVNQTNQLDTPPTGTPDTTLDWDMYFGSAFGGPGDGSGGVFVNDFRVVVSLDTDTSTNSMPTEITVFGDGTDSGTTGVNWEDYLGQECELKVVIDLGTAGVTNVTGFTHTGHVYFNGTKIADFTPNEGANFIDDQPLWQIDKLFVDHFRNSPGKGFGGGTLELDCLTLTRDREYLACSSFASEDCNGDNICDVYQLADGDRDNNGTLDICEGFCPDCNNNSIIDTYEIAQGSAPDVNANLVIDWCELAAPSTATCSGGTIPGMPCLKYEATPCPGGGTCVSTHSSSVEYAHSTGFESADGWALAALNGQKGWREYDAGTSEITNTAITNWPREGTNYLRIKKNPDTARALDIIYEPRQDAAGDGDIELWTWDWGYSATDFYQLAVEVGDICTDVSTVGINHNDGDGSGANTPAGMFDEAEWIDTANIGVSLFANVPNATPSEVTKVRVYGLQAANGVHSYLEIAGPLGANIGGSQFTDKWNAAGLKVMNKRGEYDILWGAGSQTQTTMLRNQQNQIPANGQNSTTTSKLARITETRRTLPQHYPSSAILGDGGDRQLVIRLARRDPTTLGTTSFSEIPPFGVANATEFWFDNFQYNTGKDCDADGLIDSTFLVGFPTYDRNLDGIPDNCQDCDDDCGPFPITAGQVSCLDPAEAVGNDCNANGIQDSCDINPNRPFINKVDTAGCFPISGDNFLPNGECFEARYGGGSCDANSNGIPDSCDGPDCNGNCLLDWKEIQLAGGTFGQCPGGSPALARCGGTLDVDSNGIPDECQPDCNGNNVPDGPKTTQGTDLNLGNTGNPGSQDSYPYFGNPLQIGDGIPDECCVVCTGLPGGYPWDDQCHTITPNGDMDHDGDVDARDYKFVQRCASNNGEQDNSPNPYNHPKGAVVGSATGGTNWDGISCGCADFDGNGFVDSDDLDLFQAFVTGP